MSVSRLNWTEAFTNVNQIEEYQVFRSVSVLPTELNFIQTFSLLTTLLVVRDAFGEITFNPLTYDDATVDFTTDFYHYYVLAVPTRVGESNSPQTPPSRSNIIALAEPPTTVTLSGVYDGINDEFDLTWTAANIGLLALDRYCLFRSVDGGPFALLTELPIGTLAFSDATVDRDNHVYSYYILAYDILGVAAQPSNVVTLSGTETLFFAFGAGNTVFTSPDGKGTWTPIATGFVAFTRGRGMAFSPQLQRAGIVGDAGEVLYTDDGVTFLNPPTLAGFPRQQAVAWSPTLSLFAATNDTEVGQRVYTSPDFITWTARTTPGTANLTWTSIIWVPWANGGAGAFIAGASTGGGVGSIMYSTDGITWNQIVTPVAGVTGIADNGTRLVTSDSSNINNMFTTGDPILSGSWTLNVGNNWTGGMQAIATNPNGGHDFYCAAPNPIVGDFGKICHDTDGSGLWTREFAPDNSWQTIIYATEVNLYLAAASSTFDGNPNTSLTMYSDDSGATWQFGVNPAAVWPGNVNRVGYALFGAAPPSPPVLSAFENVPLNQIELSWTASTGNNPIIEYFIYRSINAEPLGLYAVVDGSTLTYDDALIDTGLNTYNYYVIAIDSAGLVSNPSNTATI